MKILITGGTGMVGSAFKSIQTKHELVLVGSADYDLRWANDCKSMIMDNQPDAIIHLAAKVGGVKGNTDYIADFFYDNIMINTNLLNVAKDQKVKKVVSLLSTCVYPNDVTYPLTEDQIHNGEPHQSNFGYAYAKRMLDVHSRALRHQYGCNYVTAIPNNMYGPNDSYDLLNGHVIPAIIRKIWEAKLLDREPTFWGDGSSLREFSYAPDIAKTLLWMVENYNQSIPLNIGGTGESSILDIVNKVKKIIGYKRSINWDSTMPKGQFRKPSSNKVFKSLNPGFEYTDIDTGLQLTCQWFMENYPNVRGK
jgi:GDP-L-fucose synthase